MVNRETFNSKQARPNTITSSNNLKSNSNKRSLLFLIFYNEIIMFSFFRKRNRDVMCIKASALTISIFLLFFFSLITLGLKGPDFALEILKIFSNSVTELLDRPTTP